MILGVCGKIASGKTTLATELARGGSSFFGGQPPTLLEVDEYGHRLLDRQDVQEKISTFFPEAPKRVSGGFFRGWLRNKVYADPSELEKVEKILHPLMTDILLHDIEDHQKCLKSLVVVCALPKTFRLSELCDRVFILPVDKQDSWHRVQKRSPDLPRKYFDHLWQRQSREYEKPLAKNACILENTIDLFPKQ